MQNIVYRALRLDEINKIAEIDRAEEIHESYRYENGILRLYPTPEIVEAFEPTEISTIIKNQIQLKTHGGEIIGAFINNTLVGVCSVENKRRGQKNQYCKMDILYVSNSCRGNKIGHNLVLKTKEIAKKFGAKKLYISATPTKATVDFYLREGANLTENIDQELLKMEPLDIHLELDV